MAGLLHQTFYFGAGLAFVYCLGQLVYRRFRIERILLALFFFFVGMVQLHAGLYHTGDIENVPFLFLINVPSLYMIGPLLLAYFMILSSGGSGLGETHWNRLFVLHAAPAMVAAVLLVPVYFADAASRGNIIAEIRRNVDNHYVIPLFVVGLASALAYSVYIPFRLRMFRTVKSSGEYRRPAILLLASFTMAALLGNLGYLLQSVLILKLAYLNITLSLVLIYILSLRYPRLVLHLTAPRESSGELNRLRNLDLENLENKLNDLMTREKVYADEDLDLGRLAEMAAIAPAQLSQFLNGKLGRNFNTFVNAYRVQAARELLRTEPRRSILSIAHAVGFNSSSVFHDAFKKSAGMSPGEFRKQSD